MWLMPSRNRPEMCQRALDAFAAHGSTPGVLWVDGCYAGYDNIRLPKDWTIKFAGGGLAASMRWFYDEHPGLDWYGWIADDNFPETDHFDVKMAWAAGKDCMVFCNGGDYLAAENHDGDPFNLPRFIPSAMLWAGDLVRLVGWWVQPWAEQTTIDEAWRKLTFMSGRAMYLHDVMVRHEHWRTGRRAKDETDEYSLRAGAADIHKVSGWHDTWEYRKLVKKLSAGRTVKPMTWARRSK